MVHIKPENLEYVKEFAWRLSGGFGDPLLTVQMRMHKSVSIGRDIATILHQVRLNSEVLFNSMQ